VKRQRGVALLTAILVMTLAVILAFAVLESSQLQIQSNSTAQAAERARQLGIGLEDWALLLLARDEDARAGVDSRNDAWAAGLPPIPVPGGVLQGSLEDQNGKLNINNLVSTDATLTRMSKQRFARLLQVLELPPDLLANFTDYLDADGESSGGAEDLQYLGMTPARRAANRPIISIGELANVPGCTPEVLEKLAPHIAALPSGSALNINTATIEVLMSLHEGISAQLAARINAQDHANYSSVGELVTEMDRSGIRLLPDMQIGLSVQSQYFIAHAAIKLERTVFVMHSEIVRTAAGGMVIARWRG
jgi:general secretion pathway protein K